MIWTPTRSHDTARMFVRRAHSLRDLSETRADAGVHGHLWQRGYAEEPSLRFCCTDFRLALAWWSLRLLHIYRQRLWSLDQHNCGCPTCKGEKRKYLGNSYQAMPMQERRLRIALDVEPSANASDEAEDSHERWMADNLCIFLGLYADDRPSEDWDYWDDALGVSGIARRPRSFLPLEPWELWEIARIAA